MSSVNERIQERLAVIRDYLGDYHPNTETLEALRRKSLVMLIGPCAVGKSYVIDNLTNRDERYGKVMSISTREPRADDTPETMRCYAWNDIEIGELCTNIEQGDFVNYTFHPKTGDLYGSLPSSYPADVNILPTLANSVNSLSELPFKSVHTVGLVTDPAAWQQWFNERTFAGPADRAARIAEAALSLEWLIGRPDASIVTNQPGDPEVAADAIRTIVTEHVNLRDTATAEALLTHVKSLR